MFEFTCRLSAWVEPVSVNLGELSRQQQETNMFELSNGAVKSDPNPNRMVLFAQFPSFQDHVCTSLHGRPCGSGVSENVVPAIHRSKAVTLASPTKPPHVFTHVWDLRTRFAYQTLWALPCWSTPNYTVLLKPLESEDVIGDPRCYRLSKIGLKMS